MPKKKEADHALWKERAQLNRTAALVFSSDKIQGQPVCYRLEIPGFSNKDRQFIYR